MRQIIAGHLEAGGNGVDVGAHHGQMTALLCAASPAGRHFAIEPIPALAARLRAQYPTVEVVECALSDTVGEATFYYLDSRPAWSSLVHQEAMRSEVASKISVQLRPLDHVVGDTPISLVKIDVEGAEMAVLHGSAGVLRRDKPVVLFEHARIHAANFGTSQRDVWHFFAALDYVIHPVATKHPVATLEEFQRLCDLSHASGYDRTAVTNWLARPRATS